MKVSEAEVLIGGVLCWAVAQVAVETAESEVLSGVG